ncbi:MAG: AAA family ATPase [Akkermansiaceae bacterium]
MTTTNPTPTSAPAEQWQHIQTQVSNIRKETARVIVGQDQVVEQMLVSLLCKGHCLIEGVPGLAKTLLASTLGHILGLKFQRIQFTPDLMPADIIGSEILQTDSTGNRAFEFTEGPIFSNLILADEINRTPPKTQAALLEAMQEKQVTTAGKTRKLAEPFIVFATQNPIEHEGTYPLPEAQLDRFFYNIKIGYPSIEEEEKIVNLTTGKDLPTANPILDTAAVIALQDATIEVPLPENVIKAILKLTHSTRPGSEHASDFVNNYISYGAGPRASQCLAKAVRALALLRGKPAASIDELNDAALPILRHRITPNYNATGEGITEDDIITKLLA